MSRIYWGCWLVAVFLSVCVLVKYVVGQWQPTNELQRLLNSGSFDKFDHDEVQIYVPRLSEDLTLRFAGEIVDGRLFVVINRESKFQLEEVDSSCGCVVVQPLLREPDVAENHLIELAFSVNTLGKIHVHEFPLMFRFRDPDGTTRKYQASLRILLERSLEVPQVIQPIGGDDESETFLRTIPLRSKKLDIDWNSINVHVTGGNAHVAMKPLGENDGFSEAEVTLTGSLAKVSESGLVVVFESNEFRDQPQTKIPLIVHRKLIWKPERLEFDDRFMPRLIIQTTDNATADDFKIEIDNHAYAYEIKQVGRLIVVSFQRVDQELIADANELSGVIRLIKHGVVAGEIPYQWSKK